MSGKVVEMTDMKEAPGRDSGAPKVAYTREL